MTHFTNTDAAENIVGDLGGIVAIDTFQIEAGSDGEGKDTFRGLGGNDFANGAAGDDKLYGGEGGDTLIGGAGDDLLDGGDGIDEADYSLGGGVVVDLVAGTATGPTGDDTLVDIEDVLGSAFADTITGDGLNNHLGGGSGNDVLIGAGGGDYLTGSYDNDKLFGGDGVDFLDDGDGKDIVKGESGNDTIICGAGNDTIDGGSGTDMAQYFNVANDMVVDLVLQTVQDFGAAGKDKLVSIENVRTGFGNDKVFGTNGKNLIDSNNGNDTVDGRKGDDYLIGRGGDDRLKGGDGDDIIIGYDGADRMIGGKGADTFKFVSFFDCSTTVTDTISGFSHAEHDKIDVSGSGLYTGVFKFIGASGFSGSGYQVRVTVDSGDRQKVEIERTGDAAADMVFFVDSHTTLVKGDFIL